MLPWPDPNPITPPDFRKDRQTALARELLKPKYQAYGFKTTDLLVNLSEHFQNPAQIRYELLKIRGRGVIVKVKDKSFYRVTPKGWKWLWLEITSCSYFKNPIISKNFKKGDAQLAEQPSKIEEAYELIDQGLAQITSELGLVAWRGKNVNFSHVFIGKSLSVRNSCFLIWRF